MFFRWANDRGPNSVTVTISPTAMVASALDLAESTDTRETRSPVTLPSVTVNVSCSSSVPSSAMAMVIVLLAPAAEPAGKMTLPASGA